MNDRQRLEAIVDVVRSYLPPDGISREEAMSQIIGLVDPLPAQPEQEPVAWVVPDYGFLFPDKCSAQRYLNNIESTAKPTPLYTAPPSKQEPSMGLIQSEWAGLEEPPNSTTNVVEPVAWIPIEQMYPQAKAIDILMGDGSILCTVLPQFDGDLWWGGSGTGEKFIDPKYANVTHWRIHSDTAPPSKPEPVELKHLRDVHAAQGSDGAWNSNQYMCGLFNGLELALSIFENREPVYKDLAQPEQEPVAWMYVNKDGEVGDIGYGVPTVKEPDIKLLYEAPPSKPWVSLTDEEIDAIESGMSRTTFVRNIEAALKEKNT